MSDDSLGRVVKLRIYATITDLQGGVPVITYDNGYTEFTSQDPGQPPGFRIRGKCVQVQPTQGFNTNNITVQIYNLGPDSRAIIQSKIGTKIEVYAGYDNKANQIALGDILWANTHKEGPDYITEIIAGDSHFGLVNGQINISFSGAVSYQDVINALTDALKVNGIFVAIIKGVPDGGYQNGIVLNKSPFEHLSEVCKKINCSFNVIGGGIYILPLGVDTGAPAIDLSVDTGLIGIPEIQPPGLIGVVAPGTPVTPDNNISFTHLLRSDLVLSQRVRLNSKFIKGEYVIGRVTHDFDSWSGPFYSRCEAFVLQTQASSGVSGG
jgi:hypothetical protein